MKAIDKAVELELKKCNYSKVAEEIESKLLHRVCAYDFLLGEVDIDDDFCTLEECKECTFQRVYHNNLEMRYKCWNKDIKENDNENN